MGTFPLFKKSIRFYFFKSMSFVRLVQLFCYRHISIFFYILYLCFYLVINICEKYAIIYWTEDVYLFLVAINTIHKHNKIQFD